MDARAFIRRKRDGKRHDPGDIRAFIAAHLGGAVPDYQVSAWLMAAFIEGLDDAETTELTRALIESGRTFDWTPLGRPSADKHSTGGVGDKISLVLAPVVAACGVLVPMVSGRGLGHTGGTLDKFESIPGFRTRLEPDAMRDQLDRLGVIMAGQSADLAPGDGSLYALRDVTSTVESQPLIVASIVSKKIAEGAGSLVYDVKCGSGAFMKTPAEARSLATRLVEVTRGSGPRAAALITDMNQPLGSAVGNALEVQESIDVLQGGGPDDVRELTLELAAIMLQLATGADSGAARRQAEAVIESGKAWERFVALVRAQGGSVAAVEKPGELPRAPVVAPVKATHTGFVTAMDTFALGECVVHMGGGRVEKTQPIDARVGLMMRARLGDPVRAGDVLAEAHLARSDEVLMSRLQAAITIGDSPPALPPLVLERID
jgi:pyrimidine-nucleoside phosphorylase